MRFRNLKSWKNIDENRGLLFFAQRLDELTFPYSLDSYKSPTTSIQGLISEAIYLIEDAEQKSAEYAEKSMNSAEHVFSELQTRLKGNWVAAEICSTSISGATSIDFKSSSKSTLKRSLINLRAELDAEAYITAIMENVIARGNSCRDKVKLDFLARELVSTIQFLGVSREHINSTVVNFFFGERPVEGTRAVREFCQLTYPHHHKFSVFIGVDGSISRLHQDVLESYQIQIIDEKIEEARESSDGKNDEFIEKLDHLKNFSKLSNIAFMEISATDYQAAFEQAVKQIDKIRNLYQIFSHKSNIISSDFGVVIQRCCNNEVITVDAPGNSMYYIRDMKTVKASSALKRYIERMSIDKRSDAKRFENVVNIHGMSIASSSPDIQLVNLWTCLETISPSNDGASKIGNVVNRIMPILMLNYVNRLILNLLFDILRWDRRTFSHTLAAANFADDIDLKEKFIRILTDENYKEGLVELLEKCKDFELLRFRLYSISTMLSKPSKIEEKLAAHDRLVRWQIYRIYRTRNSIVHTGQSPGHTKYLVENAHDYFDQVLMFCVELSSWKDGFDTFESCFDYAERRYKEYKEQVKKSGGETAAWALPKLKGRSYIFERTSE